MFRAASFSLDSRYRWSLSRRWDAGLGRVNWIMLNPSTADGEEDDNTIRRCIRYSRDWGYKTLVVTNLFSLCATDPKVMKADPYPIGTGNNDVIRSWAGSSDLVICAWGNHGTHRGRDQEVLAILKEIGVEPHALKLTKDGHPCHPLRLPASLKPVPWLTPGP